ncbi:ATP synthase subunit f, mitochondrial-like [Mesoplodon densirostris]|uniref:ATP synthase subunit f, mitochondrial-like n=1 Tax=Mesoplodon densirostris TaxID=48708 RepID=UPI0028DC6806|nr:ATP synthase subunit f, mitochondrial-like [Mesoplodon densirostris]
MTSVVPLKEKKLLDIKLKELSSWIIMWGFIPKDITGAFQIGYYWYYNKYFNVKKGSITGLSMVLTAYVIFNYCCSYKELEHEQPMSTTEEGAFCILDHDICWAPLNLFIS